LKVPRIRLLQLWRERGKVKKIRKCGREKWVPGGEREAQSYNFVDTGERRKEEKERARGREKVQSGWRPGGQRENVIFK